VKKILKKNLIETGWMCCWAEQIISLTIAGNWYFLKN